MKVLLILSHRGQSFLSEWYEALKSNQDIQLAVLSSKPKEGHLEFNEKWKGRFSEIYSTDEIHLNRHDIASVIQKMSRQGKAVAGVVSVWEGHREMMSTINQKLGAPDLKPEQISAIQNKYQLRKKLNRLGLSEIQARMLRSSDDLKRLGRSGVRWFLKPKKGLASFGAFEWSPSVQWHELAQLKKQARDDDDYSEILGSTEFMAEQFISGQEFSFEILSGGGRQEIIAVHEKVEVEALSRTTLENACICPPQSISSSELDFAKRWIKKVFKALQLEEGAFHLEARRLGKNRWEIIEINCRVGGAYICQSTSLVSKISLLHAWAKLILEKNKDRRRSFLKSIHSKNEQDQRSFFRVFFAEPGKTIESVGFSKDISLSPVLERVFLKQGMTTPQSEREVFAAQVLWALPPEFSEIADFFRQSKNYFKIEYREGAL